MLMIVVLHIKKVVHTCLVIEDAIKIGIISIAMNDVRLRIRAERTLPIFILVYVLIQAVVKAEITKSAVGRMGVVVLV